MWNTCLDAAGHSPLLTPWFCCVWCTPRCGFPSWQPGHTVGSHWAAADQHPWTAPYRAAPQALLSQFTLIASNTCLFWHFFCPVSILLFFSPVSGRRGVTGQVLYKYLIQRYFAEAQLQWVPPPVLGLPESAETAIMSDFTTCKTGIVLPATFVLNSGASIGKALHKCSTFTISNSKSRAGQVQRARAGLKFAAISRVVCAKCFKNNLKMWE